MVLQIRFRIRFSENASVHRGERRKAAFNASKYQREG
jgi:hypothetical protein